SRQDRQLRDSLAAQQPGADAVIERVRGRLAARWPRRCRVLVVDDEPALLGLFELALGQDFEVLTAGSARAAEVLLVSQDVHILLTDLRMPGRSGIDLLEWAQQRTPRTIRLLMSGDGDMDDTVEAINRGQVYSFISKPYRTDDLRLVLRN